MTTDNLLLLDPLLGFRKLDNVLQVPDDFRNAWFMQELSGAVAGATNVAVALGRELVINGDFADWTTDNPDGWTIAGEVGADPEASEVGTGEGHGGIGTGFANLFSSATNFKPELRQDILAVGKTDTCTININTATSGAIYVRSGTDVILGPTSTLGDNTFTFTATSVQFKVAVFAAPTDITIDNVSVKQTNIAANDSNLDGAHTGISRTTGNRQIPVMAEDDAATSFTNLLTDKTHNSILDPAQFEIHIVGQKDTWDTTKRYLISHIVDAGNWIKIGTSATEGFVFWEYRAGGVTHSATLDVSSTTALFDIGMAVKSGALHPLYNAEQVGSDVSITNPYVGNHVSMVLGAENTTPNGVHRGSRAYYQEYSDVLTSSQRLRILRAEGIA